MDKKLEIQLQTDFPQIFIDLYGDRTSTCMTWGCSCSDGWYDIIYDCCKKLQRLMDENPGYKLYATQIKEKYGSLRFYINFNNDEISDKDFNETFWNLANKIVEEVEEKSYYICELCGKPGKINGTGWYRCLCKHCKKRGI